MTMATPIDFEQYKAFKKAKRISTDLENIIKLLLVQQKALRPHCKYVPIKEIYQLMARNQSLLSLHLAKYRKLVQNKGKIDNE